jgi:membrane fusion protein (multidrug efflux system)
MTIDTPENKTTNSDEAQPTLPGRKRLVRLAGLGLAAVAAIGGAAYYIQSRAYESTDNAFLEGGVIQISPRVGGQVLHVLVADNQHVNRGDLIAEIDPQDYEARVAEARARLADMTARSRGALTNVALTSTVTSAVLTQTDAAEEAAREQVLMLNARLRQSVAAVKAAEAAVGQAAAQQSAAEAEARRAADDAVRYRSLYAKDEVSKQQLDRVETQARAAAATLTAATEAGAAARARQAQSVADQSSAEAAYRQSQSQFAQAQGRVSEANAGPRQVDLRKSEAASLEAGVEQSAAVLRQAELALSYTRIYAPESGYITRKAVEAGNFAQTGQPLMALVPDRLWVIANFKETQLAGMRTGQPVTIRVDAYPQLRLRAHVDSIQSGTGARFSLLPTENATGNYVKVVQRVPVKIVLDETPPVGYRLGPGMSVVPEVRVK